MEKQRLKLEHGDEGRPLRQLQHAFPASGLEEAAGGALEILESWGAGPAGHQADIPVALPRALPWFSALHKSRAGGSCPLHFLPSSPSIHSPGFWSCIHCLLLPGAPQDRDLTPQS